MKIKLFFADCKTRYLALLTVLTLLFTIGIGNAWADYTITFKENGASDGSSAKTTKADIVDTGGDYVSSIDGASRVYQGKTGYGVKLGASGGIGKFTINFSTSGQVKPTKIIVKACRYGSDTGNLKYKINGGTENSITLTSSLADYEITMNGSTTITSLYLASSTKRIYIKSVTVVVSSAKTFTLALPKGDGTYNTTSLTGQQRSALTEANAISGATGCSYGLEGEYMEIWVASPITKASHSSYPSYGTYYTSDTPEANLPSSGSTLYPVFSDGDYYFTDPRCDAAPKTLSSIAITTQPTTKKYLVGETFSSTGAVVTATYSDATTATVSATWTPTTGLVSGSNTITASYTEGGVTKTATTTVTAYAVTVQKQDEDGNTISAAGVSASATGRSLTASVGSTHYVFHTWKFGTASGTSISNATSATTGALTGTPSAAVTVIAEFYKPCTVTWSVSGNTSTISATTNVTHGTTVSMPTPSIPVDCTGSTFMGWTTSANASYSGDSAPSPLYNTTSPAITGDVTFYAVFATED